MLGVTWDLFGDRIKAIVGLAPIVFGHVRCGEQGATRPISSGDVVSVGEQGFTISHTGPRQQNFLPLQVTDSKLVQNAGAIGMLASNMMLGQGPYTPWQMAAWGLVGLAGALLGRVSGRRMGRFGLALACAVMALVAKEIMNVYTWTLGAAHTPAAFLLIAGGALPFDITDTVASFLFGFAFGPELARLLGRMPP